jgi:hypothetical protein
MDTLEIMVDFPSEVLYVDVLLEFRKMYEKFPNFLKYVESTILGPLKKRLVRA